ncbi:Hypothetical predicted protein [Paramuricea clavata]|uniref:Uncharacterized protein n=1 Tax=Paramuricea clavata TaxID=317549 RepID=A0A6S7KS52_PARCT|nr:Hypothetical predicted protein [Paramuricea clavata]
MMDQLKSNPNPKKLWECIKQLGGYPKANKKVFSSLVCDDEIINGEVLAIKINDAFTATTQEMSPLKQPPTETQIESSQYLTLPEYIPPHCNSNLQDLVAYIFITGLSQQYEAQRRKRKEMVIDFSKEKRNFTPLLINDVPVKRVESTRILGTTFQDNMNWNDHIHQIVRKAVHASDLKKIERQFEDIAHGFHFHHKTCFRICLPSLAF